jgi:acyl-CoA synthetase (AMP-forming)/AMP-acid ligase II
MPDPTTIFAAFTAAADRWPEQPFLAILPETAAAYDIGAGEIRYAALRHDADALATAYREAGYGAGQRVGLLLQNRPEFFLHWLALNAAGVSVVPINPDLRATEIEYLIGHSELVLLVAIPQRHTGLRAAVAAIGKTIAVVGPHDRTPAAPWRGGPPSEDPASEAALLYTSGTTGLPKGCVVSQTWFLECGRWYVGMGQLCALAEGTERMLTPLPLFHMNAMACSTMAMILSGGCLIPLDRFHPSTWWDSVARSRATIVHCLGVMPAMLMSAPPTPAERAHAVRFAFCPGPDRRLHAEAEARFGMPLIDAWAMTETGAGAVVAAYREPRRIGESCFGRADPTVDIRIIDDAGHDSPIDTPGELLVRRAGPDPRFGFFTEYLKDPDATATAWADGWFHTGDIVRRDDAGNMYFVDRKKNVIRRSGENISAIEVEGVLQQHPAVRAAAVAAVPDPIRGDEVLACIIAQQPAADPRAAAQDIVTWCLSRLAYYKAPGYVVFVETLPLTSTNKIQRGVMKDLASQALANPTCIDTRAMKQRTA